MPGAVDRDLGKLDPTFRAKVEELLRRMTASGFDPKVHEAWRSFARAQELQAKGVGVAKSMHCYGLAVDIISESERWGAPPAFWRQLGAHARLLGLVWGGDFKRVDKPHVQAVRISDQAMVRRAKPEEIAALVKRRLG